LSRRSPEIELERIRRVYKEECADFAVNHFHEAQHRHRNQTLGYTVTRLASQMSDDGKTGTRAPGRGQHRKKRIRRPMVGMMLVHDGSTHRWLAPLGHEIDPIVTMDDATNWIYQAFLVDRQGTMSRFGGLRETIEAHGLFGTF
jgi:hypothetical protein